MNEIAEMVGGNEWEAAFQKAKALASQMTLEEKMRGDMGSPMPFTSDYDFFFTLHQVNLTADGTANSGCSGTIPVIERLDFPGICVSDAGNGLRNTDFVGSFLSGIHVGAR